MSTNIQSAIPQSTPEAVSKEILIELFMNAHAGDGSEWDKRVEKAWEQEFGYPFERIEDDDLRPSFALYGPPGHGKTAAFKEAGKRFSKAMGMRFVSEPAEDFVPSKEDFVFVSLEMAGEVSNMTTAGIPTKSSFTTSDGREVPVMEKLISRQFLQLQEAGSGILLLDDFNNAVHNVQNQLLSIAQFRRIQSVHFGRALVGLTGNLGAADNTEVYSPKLALKTRCQQIYVEDNPKDFVKRADAKYAASTAGFIRAKDIINAFISHREDQFAGDPSSVRVEQGDVYACPRSWENLIKVMGPRMKMIEQLGDAAALSAQNIAHRLVGGDVAQKFSEYFYQMTTSALPLARELVENGQLSEESKRLFQSKIGSGVSSTEQDFSQQFSMALGNLVAEKVVDINKGMRGEKKEKALSEIGCSYYGGLSMIEPSHQFLSMSRLRSRVENVVGDVLSGDGDKVVALWKHLSKGMVEGINKFGISEDELPSFKENVGRVFSKNDAISSKVSIR